MKYGVHFSIAVLTFALSLGACKKYEDTSTVTITVKNKTTNAPVSGANVEITSIKAQTTPGQSLSPHLPSKETTDGSGQSFHEIKYEGILDIIVTSSQGDTTDFIRTKIGESFDKTLYVD